MKITKRLSLQSALSHRLIAPKPSSQWLKRNNYQRSLASHQLTTEEELTKFGYTNKHRVTPSVFILGLCTFGAGLWLYVYLQQLYRNEKKARYKYRIMEIEQPSVKLRMRHILVEMAAYMDKNTFIMEFTNKNKKLDKMTESTLRLLQYRNFMQKRDTKFDFMELGVMQKFPYPSQ